MENLSKEVINKTPPPKCLYPMLIISSDPKKLVGRMCGKEGQVFSEGGDVIGRVGMSYSCPMVDVKMLTSIRTCARK